MIKKLMMLCVAAIAAMGAWAEVYYDWYSNDDGNNTITLSGVYVDGVMPNPLIIPSEYDGRTVTRISSIEFSLEESDIIKAKSIVLPNSLLAIEDNIFVGCMRLEKVDVVPGGKYKTRDNMLLSVDEKELVTVYGKASFSRTSLTIPDTVEVMGWWALFNSEKLKSVEIPKNVREIKGNPFVCCYALENISLHPANSAYKIENELLLTKDGKKLIATAGSYTKKRRDIVVPEGVEEVCELSLTSDMVDIRNVWMPKTLKVLHDALEWGGHGGKNNEYGAMENVVFQAQEKFEIAAGACLFCDCDINNVWFAGPVPENFYSEGCSSEGWWECGNVRKIHYTAEYKDEWEEALRNIGYANRGQVNGLEEFPKPPAQQDTTIIQESYGPFVPGTEVELNLGIVGYTAKNLPSGLKLDKKTGVVQGKAKKSGEYQATFTKKGAETLTAKFIVGPMPTITITMEGDIEKCKVTGASKPGMGYIVGKKVSLSAKGPKGTAFTGWFKDGEPWPNETEYLESKRKYVMTEENLSLVARFEKEKMSVSCDWLSALAVGEEVAFPIAIETQSGVKSVKGSKLPTGLKVMKDKVTGEWFVTGRPKKVGAWNSVIEVTAKSGAVEQLPVAITVAEAYTPEGNLTAANGYFRVSLKNGKDEKYTLSVGITNIDEFVPSLELNSPTAKLAVSGLPAGLKYDAADGKITGIATKAGTYTVTLTVTDGKEKYISTITIELEALPDWVVGTFDGYFEEYGWYDEWRQIYPDSPLPSGCDWEAFGRFTVSVTETGKVTGKFVKAHETQSFTAALVNVEENRYEFFADYATKDGNGWDERAELSFAVIYDEYENTHCARIEGKLLGDENNGQDMPFVREFYGWRNLWNVKGISLPEVAKAATYTESYADGKYDIYGKLTLSFSAGRNTVVASFAFDDFEDQRTLKITKCTSQLIVTGYDENSGVFSMLLPVYMKHLDEPGDDEWIDLDFFIPMEIDIKGNVNILWDDVRYAHDDWW